VAWGCCKILENFEHSQWMGRNAQEKTMREFTWEYIANSTERVYYDLLNMQDAPRSNDTQSGYPMSSAMLKEVCFKMGKDDPDQQANRGIALLKMMKLLVASVGGDATMTWMGTEFGQIDPVDMPRPGNGFNEEFSRVKYELADNTDLKFCQVEAFEASLNNAAGSCRWNSAPKYDVLKVDEEAKTLAFKRGSCIFAFNFHTSRTAEVEVPAAGGPLVCVLDTDAKKFGGGAAAERGGLPVKGDKATVRLAPRTACALAAKA